MFSNFYRVHSFAAGLKRKLATMVITQFPDGILSMPREEMAKEIEKYELLQYLFVFQCFAMFSEEGIIWVCLNAKYNQ